AEGGIRDFHVTGVQTCALPICRKKSVSKRPAGSAKTPPVTTKRWLSRSSLAKFIKDPAAPAFGSEAPKTTRSNRALTIAPAHIETGRAAHREGVEIEHTVRLR